MRSGFGCNTAVSNLGYLATPGQFFMGAKLFIEVPWCETKLPSIFFSMGFVKMNGFHGNPLYDSREWGVGLQIQSYLRFYLS